MSQTRTGLHDGAVEKTLCGVARHQRADLRAPTRFTEDHHLVRISSESGDVVFHPLKGEDHVEHARGAGIGEAFAIPGEVHVAEHVEAVIDRDHHDVAALREAHAVIGVGRS